ncbi:MAG: ABC transporter permease [Hyphomicrobiales bacterium]|nr:ABC transporter permease [Hyphomicrobiales bacterium]MBV8664084.1 ABC transporter permease [Hyphomicrobiales bacterium]
MTERASVATPLAASPALPTRQSAMSEFLRRLRRNSEYIAIPLFALIIAAILFSLFLLSIGRAPADFVAYVWRGGFGTAFSLQNTLERSAPLILTALAVAIPARIGLIMIGGEGALVVGGFAAAAVATPLIGVLPPAPTLIIMFVVAALVGAVWVGLAGYLRYARGVNETISSLLLTYIGIAIMNFFVEGVLRDLTNPNKPSTKPLGEAYMVGKMPGTDVHWGFAVGVLFAILLQVLMSRTTFGFAARIVGGNFRAALAQGLKVGRIIVVSTMIAGACAGVAGFYEVAAIQGRANASLAAGYDFTGILVSFLARHNPIAIVPVAVLFGGLVASGGLIQRRMGLPDATVLVLQGLIFLVLLVSETLYGRFSFFRDDKGSDRT